MNQEFPGIGHRYFVDFDVFRGQLFFESDTRMTYAEVRPDGTFGVSDTVPIKVVPIRDDVFVVTWQESDKATVVHVEDYREHTVVTNITHPDLTFEQFHGTFMQLSGDSRLQ